VLDRGQAELRELINRILAEETDFRAQIERMVTVAFDYLLKNPSLARLSLRAALGDGLSRPYDERWLGMMEVMLRPRAVKGEIKDIDPALFLITQSAVITQHVIANGTYRDLVGKSVSTTEAETRTREHLKQVVLRSLGLDEKTPGGER
jgi:AcrR family transcriptional regulator